MAPRSATWPDLYAPDLYDSDVARSAGGMLADFNRAGVLSAADVHVALRLARLGAEADERVALAAALAVRAPRVGHVYVDLAAVRHSAADEDDELDLRALPWPEVGDWIAQLAQSGMVATGEHGPDDRPLRLIQTALYLDRYWRDERSVADATARPGWRRRLSRGERLRWQPGWLVSFPPTSPSRGGLPSPPFSGACVSSPADPAAARPPRWRGSSPCSTSRPGPSVVGRPSSAWPHPPVRPRPAWRKPSTPRPCGSTSPPRSASVSCRFAPPRCTGSSGAAPTPPAAFAITVTTGCLMT